MTYAKINLLVWSNNIQNLLEKHGWKHVNKIGHVAVIMYSLWFMSDAVLINSQCILNRLAALSS